MTSGVPARAASRARALADLLDTAVRIPGTRIRFGLDAVLGLVPGIGDLASAVLSGYIVLSAVRSGVPLSVVTRMLLNLGTDTLVGSIPLLGDLFDVGYRANQRNADLLERHLAEPATTARSSRWAAVLAMGGIIALLALAIAIAMLAAAGLNRLST